jgi:hypothetical protein
MLVIDMFSVRSGMPGKMQQMPRMSSRTCTRRGSFRQLIQNVSVGQGIEFEQNGGRPAAAGLIDFPFDER